MVSDNKLCFGIQCEPCIVISPFARVVPSTMALFGTERGSPSNKLHSWTSEELGKPELLLHLGTVVGLMKINNDYDEFHAQLDKIVPVYPENPTLFDDPKDWELPK